jgi:hypothetical protein
VPAAVAHKVQRVILEHQVQRVILEHQAQRVILEQLVTQDHLAQPAQPAQPALPEVMRFLMLKSVQSPLERGELPPFLLRLQQDRHI